MASTDPLSAPLEHLTLDSHKIVVGVDFGTTYTGVGYFSTDPAHEKIFKDVKVIGVWPTQSQLPAHSCRVLSRLSYAKENDPTGNAFGFQVKSGAYSWMKLLLDHTQAPKFDDPTLSNTEGLQVLAKPADKTPVQLCADFLAQVAMHAHATLNKDIAQKDILKTKLEVWFSVPAFWSDKAKVDTLRAARMAAKITNLQIHPSSEVFLIGEPEAAAIAAISGLSKGGSEVQIKGGDNVLVCDCGGGTVDITTYEITALSPKLVFKELIAGTGGKCGSTYIDRQFMKWMQKTFGNAYTSLPWRKRGPSSTLMHEFNTIKCNFGKPGGSGFSEMKCTMEHAPNSVNYDAVGGIVKISQADVQGFFRTVIKRIVALLESQLQAEIVQHGRSTIKTVILVGMFGDSVYFKDEIRKWCTPKGIRLIWPNQPQDAIVRGAALAGLNNISPTSRRARRHYGFILTSKFDKAIHTLQDKYFDDRDGFWRARDCLYWVLKKGQSIHENTAISHDGSIWVYGNDIKGYKVEVYEADGVSPPYPHIGDHRAPKLLDFNIDLSGVDLGNFLKGNVQGRGIRKVECKYHVRSNARRGVLEFSATAGGKEIGKSTVTSDGQEGLGVGSSGSGDADSSRCAMQ